jgi:pimeloyl-ACP methyl ester carboxylesterase
LDWHGPSTRDAWSSLEALEQILAKNTLMRNYRLEPESRVVIVGHSNGGQGTWYMASRFPDRVLGSTCLPVTATRVLSIFLVIPVSAYIKSQAYVPLTLSRKVPVSFSINNDLMDDTDPLTT